MRKPSAASSPPREPPTFFVERSLGKGILVAALRARGLNVVVHDEILPQDALDPVWLRLAGREGWIVLTKDGRIRYREIERTALIESRVRAFIHRP